ncbi:hypothetical protein [Endozoicomonas sp. GU-1]|uniref:hypothetical protein n=1 Tax=Endozoicomonas sp. GU-1 TaxID=3009078 RepID=UPI0022B3EEA5|nr:hypothetical protein [Endozoicomonas sp. GU-1]WBA80271.1 hypothetical protein O2T12_18290 [Endozoicomonas sp. GU-1]WBA87841.1 hypothetical protein O3276_07500 [Endozoicomonas sp. GU-1]
MISSSTQLPPLTGATSPVGSTENTQTEKAAVNPELQTLQDVFSDRLKQAESLLSNDLYVRDAIFDLFRGFAPSHNANDSDRCIERDNDNFAALALAQCNLASSEGISILQQVNYIQDDIIKKFIWLEDPSGATSEEPTLEALERDLGAISRADNQIKSESGAYCMGIERQGFVEQQIEAWFQEDKQQRVKDTLMLLKNQITSGGDIGRIEAQIMKLKLETAGDLATFSANFKYPNRGIFNQAREELLNKSSDLEQHFTNKENLTRALQGTVPEDQMEQLIQALSHPVSEMTTKAMVLASIITHHSEKHLKSYLKAAQILSLKTQAQADNPALSDSTALAMGLERSDAMVREHYQGGAKSAASSAADALINSLTPLPEDLTAMA